LNHAQIRAKNGLDHYSSTKSRRTVLQVRSAQRYVALAALITAMIFGCPASRSEAVVAAGSSAQSLAYDFLIANVCLDSQGRKIIGVSPIDGDPWCVAQRDLNVGEALPYHTQQAAVAGGAAPEMTKGSDSFPVRSAQLGVLAVHLYDYEGRQPGKAFGAYSTGDRIGGGTIASISNGSAAFIATQLGPQDLQLFVGPGCQPNQPVGPQALRDAWILAPMDKLANVKIPNSTGVPGQPIAGGIVSNPSRMVASGQSVCPPRMPYSTTRWSIVPVIYRAQYKAGPKQGQHVILWTLIAEHFGRDSSHLNDALAIERAYFTRELGWTRWEAWKSLAGGRNQGRSAAANGQVMGRDNCALPTQASPTARLMLPSAPLDANGAPRSDMVITGCVEATQIVPPHGPQGDPPPTGPGTWLNSISNTAIGPISVSAAQ
jgi:hypothetical protein